MYSRMSDEEMGRMRSYMHAQRLEREHQARKAPGRTQAKRGTRVEVETSRLVAYQVGLEAQPHQMGWRNLSLQRRNGAAAHTVTAKHVPSGGGGFLRRTGGEAQGWHKPQKGSNESRVVEKSPLRTPAVLAWLRK